MEQTLGEGKKKGCSSIFFYFPLSFVGLAHREEVMHLCRIWGKKFGSLFDQWEVDN
jgi:hypothetical protein